MSDRSNISGLQRVRDAKQRAYNGLCSVLHNLDNAGMGSTRMYGDLKDILGELRQDAYPPLSEPGEVDRG